ncbi:MAG: ferrous iron transport protein B [Candidatus Sumerlaeia bacterium]|nr:ferrous iron transport protein B [Candidatus Sumerlaeia bacterium]
MAATATRDRRIALIGNPNTGKTTLFNALTGHRARVGNYSGVTVEKREGLLKAAAAPTTLVDLPGTYSLAAASPDEMLAVNLLLGLQEGEERPDGLVVVVDSTNLERNLFLALQLLEAGLPTVVALNMADAAREQGRLVDAAALAQRLGAPCLAVSARTGDGLPELAKALDALGGAPPAPPQCFPAEFERAAAELAAAVDPASAPGTGFLVRRALLEAEGMAERELAELFPGSPERVAAARSALEAAGLKPRSLEATSRYRWIREHVAPLLPKAPSAPRDALTDRVDAILTHKVFGTAIFLVLMAVVFQSIYSWSGPLMDLIDAAFGALGGWASEALPEGPMRSLVADGILAGVGGVLIFLPQICILFLFISLLEDIGYMSRAAFLMDRVLSRCGLSGRSFIPMLSSFACAIPGVMAARTIEDPRDRLATILVAPLMSCSARLPVYTLLIGAFVPDRPVLGVLNLQGLTLLAMYLVGVVVAIPVALLLKRTILKGKTPTFLIELPPYRRPLVGNLLHRVIERGQVFVVKAGTVIMAASIIIWGLSYYPRSLDVDLVYDTKALGAEMRLASAEAGALEAALAEVEAEREGAHLRNSFLGRFGRVIEPAVEPLGWDWRIGMAAIASFPAREVIVATLGVIFDLGAESADDEASLAQKLAAATREDTGEPLFNLPVALSIMVFFALCMQCVSTLAIMRRETNGWKWPAFAFGYMTTLAYLGAFAAYQIASALLA